MAWLRVEDKGILSIHTHVITRNYRVTLSTSDERTFNLHIKNVHESDRGGYMCQVRGEAVLAAAHRIHLNLL